MSFKRTALPCTYRKSLLSKMLIPISVNGNWEDTLWGPFSLINNASFIIFQPANSLRIMHIFFSAARIRQGGFLFLKHFITNIYRLNTYGRCFYLSLTIQKRDCDHTILQIKWYDRDLESLAKFPEEEIAEHGQFPVDFALQPMLITIVPASLTYTKEGALDDTG